jgi:hypothetical protein
VYADGFVLVVGSGLEYPTEATIRVQLPIDSRLTYFAMVGINSVLKKNGLAKVCITEPSFIVPLLDLQAKRPRQGSQQGEIGGSFNRSSEEINSLISCLISCRFGIELIPN